MIKITTVITLTLNRVRSIFANIDIEAYIHPYLTLNIKSMIKLVNEKL